MAASPRFRSFTADLTGALKLGGRATREAESLCIALDALPEVPDLETVTALRARLTVLMQDHGTLRARADGLITEYAALSRSGPRSNGSHLAETATRARREAPPPGNQYGSA